jgi:transcriptional repressor NrdR
MRCPYCDHRKDKVVDSRESKEGDLIRRRRECLNCQRRFTSYEKIEHLPFMVIKKGGNRESFQKEKILRGLLRACEKRPVSTQQLDNIIDSIEKHLADCSDREIPSSLIGQMIMEQLRALDKVAYVRFASVYLDFKSAEEFMQELNQLLARN